jgi:hypothetical protein
VRPRLDFVCFFSCDDEPVRELDCICRRRVFSKAVSRNQPGAPVRRRGIPDIRHRVSAVPWWGRHSASVPFRERYRRCAPPAPDSPGIRQASAAGCRRSGCYPEKRGDRGLVGGDQVALDRTCRVSRAVSDQILVALPAAVGADVVTSWADQREGGSSAIGCAARRPASNMRARGPGNPLARPTALKCLLWSEQMEGFGMPAQPSPSAVALQQKQRPLIVLDWSSTHGRRGRFDQSSTTAGDDRIRSAIDNAIRSLT